jgi:hypothetical protein
MNPTPPDQTPVQPGAPAPQQAALNPSDIENTLPNVPQSAADAPEPELVIQLGETGDLVISGLLSGNDYNPDLTGTKRISEYDKMRLGDATVRAALQAVKLPLKAANWFIKAPEEGKEDDEKVVFIKEQILENDNFSWTQLLNKVLTFCDYGNAVFEKVFYQTDDGKIGLKKLGHRVSKTIYRWTLEDGKTPGITQFIPASTNGNTKREIPKWKLMYFINELEGSNYEGISLLRAAHKHWYFKDLYYRIDVMATEKHGLGVPIVKHPPNAKPDDVKKARELARNIRANEFSHMDLPNGFSIEMLDMKALELKDPKEMIGHHNREIVLSFLAEFLDLGAGKAGSYALAKDKSDFFMLALESLAKVIQEQFNLLIKEMIILNFGEQDIYPTLEYSGVGNVDVETLSNALQRFGSAGFIHADEQIEKKLREEMNLPEQDPAAWEEIKQQEQQKLDNEQAMNDLYLKSGNQPQNGGKNGQPIKPGGKPKPLMNNKTKFIQASEDFMEDVMELREEVERIIHAKRAE